MDLNFKYELIKGQTYSLRCLMDSIGTIYIGIYKNKFIDNIKNFYVFRGTVNNSLYFCEPYINQYDGKLSIEFDIKYKSYDGSFESVGRFGSDYKDSWEKK